MGDFVIHALPRSRTAWLSEFLTYRDHVCKHELSLELRTLEDIPNFFTGKKGTADTGCAQGWWLIRKYIPDIKVVVVKRPLQEVVDSLLDVDISGVATYDKDVLYRHMEYTDRMLGRISALPDVLTIEFKDLDKMSTCQKIFERCLPYDFDIRHWSTLKNKNIQVNVKDKIRYYQQNMSAIENFKKLCKRELIRLRRHQPEALWKVN